jgi:F0F1-type ATP synthase membrane subunit b/b'
LCWRYIATLSIARTAVVSLVAVAVSALVVTDPPDDEQRRGDQADAVQALVGEQLRAARAEVFRAYLQARDRARELVEEERDEADRHGSTAS